MRLLHYKNTRQATKLGKERRGEERSCWMVKCEVAYITFPPKGIKSMSMETESLDLLPMTFNMHPTNNNNTRLNREAKTDIHDDALMLFFLLRSYSSCSSFLSIGVKLPAEPSHLKGTTKQTIHKWPR